MGGDIVGQLPQEGILWKAAGDATIKLWGCVSACERV